MAREGLLTRDLAIEELLRSLNVECGPHTYGLVQAAMKESRIEGMHLAAEVARSYNSVSSHAFDLGDCILAKLNQLPKAEIHPRT